MIELFIFSCFVWTYLHFFRVLNGIYEYHFNGEKQSELKWSISNGGIHMYASGSIGIYRINQDKSITHIANIDKDGKRRDLTKEEQSTYEIIK